jgi:hypothetical protein
LSEKGKRKMRYQIVETRSTYTGAGSKKVFAVVDGGDMRLDGAGTRTIRVINYFDTFTEAHNATQELNWYGETE